MMHAPLAYRGYAKLRSDPLSYLTMIQLVEFMKVCLNQRLSRLSLKQQSSTTMSKPLTLEHCLSILLLYHESLHLVLQCPYLGH